MKNKAILLYADGTHKSVHPHNGKFFSLKELQNFVGGYIEICQTKEEGFALIINEEGKILKLPKNKKATKHYLYSREDSIVGDALLCDRSWLKK